MSGKGDKPRNVGPKFKENYDTIDWRKKQSSEKWCEEKGVDPLNIISPDGWDRTCFQESWTEKITEEEFNKRLSLSIIQTKIE